MARLQLTGHLWIRARETSLVDQSHQFRNMDMIIIIIMTMNRIMKPFMTVIMIMVMFFVFRKFTDLLQT